MCIRDSNRADLAASFQKSVVDVLVEHTMLAAKDYHMDKIAIAGGVASNGALREAMTKACEKRGYKFYRPSPIFCTDNAAMIGVAAYYEYIKGCLLYTSTLFTKKHRRTVPVNSKVNSILLQDWKEKPIHVTL